MLPPTLMLSLSTAFPLTLSLSCRVTSPRTSATPPTDISDVIVAFCATEMLFSSATSPVKDTSPPTDNLLSTVLVPTLKTLLIFITDDPSMLNSCSPLNVAGPSIIIEFAPITSRWSKYAFWHEISAPVILPVTSSVASILTAACTDSTSSITTADAK